MSNAIDWHESIAVDFDAKYQKSAAFRERLAVWSDLVDRNVDASARVLDAGCGSGVMSALAAARGGVITGFDGSEAMLALARRRLPDARWLEGRLGDPALLAGEHFDAILCSSVLEYLDDWEAGLRWLTDRLAPGGVMIVSLPNGQSLYRGVERLVYRLTGRPQYYEHVKHVVSRDQAKDALKRHGLAMQEHVFYAATPFMRSLADKSRAPALANAMFAFVIRRDA